MENKQKRNKSESLKNIKNWLNGLEYQILTLSEENKRKEIKNINKLNWYLLFNLYRIYTASLNFNCTLWKMFLKDLELLEHLYLSIV